MAQCCTALHGAAWLWMVLHGAAWLCMVLHSSGCCCLMQHFTQQVGQGVPVSSPPMAVPAAGKPPWPGFPTAAASAHRQLLPA